MCKTGYLDSNLNPESKVCNPNTHKVILTEGKEI